MEIKAENLAYWFFRLNGFLTTVNFVVHAKRRGQSGTDADILGVRFPYRAELFEDPMEDYEKFRRVSSSPYVVIAEVKKGMCDLNGPWVSPEKRNINRVLRAIGIIPLDDIDDAATSLYEKGVYKCSLAYISLVCIGERSNDKLARKYPSVPQVLWSEILSFIYQRFHDYRNAKSWHQSWDKDGHKLWNSFKKSREINEFQQRVEIVP